jgi:ABC-2 type transport system ATP-binding protein
MPIALTIKSLIKTYANDFHALKGIDLSVEEGDFFALLGSNGAGKTTMIGIVCGLLEKTTGEVNVLGLDQANNAYEIKRLI